MGSSAETTRDADLRRLGTALRQVIRGLGSAGDSSAKELGMHPTDFACIGYLYRRATPLSPRDVIAHMGLTSGSGTALFDRLEAAGYIRRMPNPDDRRSLLLELDTKAAATAIARHVGIEQSYLRVIDTFKDDEIATIRRFLESFAEVTIELRTDKS